MTAFSMIILSFFLQLRWILGLWAVCCWKRAERVDLEGDLVFSCDFSRSGWGWIRGCEFS